MLNPNARASLDNESHFFSFHPCRRPCNPVTAPGTPPIRVATKSIKAAQTLTLQNLLINSVLAPNDNHSMTVGVDVEETATTRTRDDVSFSHCDGSSVTVAPPFRDSGHREIALALDPNLHLTDTIRISVCIIHHPKEPQRRQ